MFYVLGVFMSIDLVWQRAEERNVHEYFDSSILMLSFETFHSKANILYSDNPIALIR